MTVAGANTFEVGNIVSQYSVTTSGAINLSSVSGARLQALTPYFFHQLSGTEMEIHSAGPDRKMWTSDDLVTK